MNKIDSVRVIEHSKNANKIYVLGPKPIVIREYYTKISDNASECDLIIISENIKHLGTLNFLNSLSHDCTILFYNFTFPTYTKHVLHYLLSQENRFTVSKQMVIDDNNNKQKTLIVIHHPFAQERSKQILVSKTPDKKQTSIFLVLKTGGPTYDYRYVNALAQNIRRNTSFNHEIVCLTDNHKGIDYVDRIVNLRNGWPKWWGKIELFRDDISTNDECLYFDLDTVCTGNIDFMNSIEDDKMYGLRDFYQLDIFQTGLMRWVQNDETFKIYNKFKDGRLEPLYRGKGDHEYMNTFGFRNYLQDKFPNRIVSYKKSLTHLVKGTINPSIICFHGDPRPHTVRHKFVSDNWNY